MKRAALFIVLALGMLGCERENGPGSPGGGREAAVASDLLQARPAALLSTAHRGIRRVSFMTPGGLSVIFREEIVTDGQGRFAIQPLEPLGPGPIGWAQFELQQRVRQGYIFRYRDFVLRDVELFRRNWGWTELGQEVVAARSCARYRVERLLAPVLVYDIAVDLETGIVLAFRLLDEDGVPSASVTYETFELAPDLAGVAWHQPANQEQELDWTNGLAAAVGAPFLKPRLLPDGYQLRSAAIVVDEQDRRWLKLTYLDGIEPLFFLQVLDVRAEDEPSGQPPGQNGALEQLTGGPPEPGTVVVFQIGTTTAIQGRIDGHELIALGRASEAELLDLLESALP